MFASALIVMPLTASTVSPPGTGFGSSCDRGPQAPLGNSPVVAVGLSVPITSVPSFALTETDRFDVMPDVCIGPIARKTEKGRLTAAPPAINCEAGAVVVMVATNSGKTRNGSSLAPVAGFLVPSMLGGNVPRPVTAVSISAPPGRMYLLSNAGHASYGV